ncbi:MAG: serine/threonine protein phosphatase PrpC [Verrucomicrobiales bacterium]|jgi:serine/threonine protein phosphatase PrpC
MANGSLFVVADGMGGHRGGEVAAGITSGHFTDIESVSSVDELRDVVIAANDLIRAKGASDPDLGGMGTTVVAMGVLPTSSPDDALKFAAANVGDSRLYLFEGGELGQVSVDHSLVAELTKAGQITEEEAARHPQRNVVTRALGAEQEVKVDTWELPARLGQRYLLCSDGLVNEVADEVIGETLSTIEDPVSAAKQLVDRANESGGRDNITVLILDIVEAAHVTSDDSQCDPAATTS